MKKVEQPESEGTLVHAAKALGGAAGKIAAMAGAHADAATPARRAASQAKLEKKSKHRLPRKLKKANAKKAASAL